MPHPHRNASPPTFAPRLPSSLPLIVHPCKLNTPDHTPHPALPPPTTHPAHLQHNSTRSRPDSLLTATHRPSVRSTPPIIFHTPIYLILPPTAPTPSPIPPHLPRSTPDALAYAPGEHQPQTEAPAAPPRQCMRQGLVRLITRARRRIAKTTNRIPTHDRKPRQQDKARERGGGAGNGGKKVQSVRERERRNRETVRVAERGIRRKESQTGINGQREGETERR